MPGVFLAVGGGGQDAAHVADVGFHATEALEPGAGLAGDDLGKGSLARAGRPVKNEGLDAIGLDGAPKQLPRCQDMPLPRELVEVAGPHAGRQRLRGKGLPLILGRAGRGVRKQIFAGHIEKIA